MSPMERYAQVVEAFRQQERALVAFSGGIDSSLLLYAAHEALGDNVLAVTAYGLMFPVRETRAAAAFCDDYGIRQELFEHQALDLPGMRENPEARCYCCKQALFEHIVALAQRQGISFIAEGSNRDDDGAHRPGRRALDELQIAKPLHDAGMTKADIRAAARELDLPNWDAPTCACLATRFHYNSYISAMGLMAVDAAENIILDKGISQVRVRVVAENQARIEVPAEEIALLQQKPTHEDILTGLYGLGFTVVDIDPRGYRTGSMDEQLTS